MYICVMLRTNMTDEIRTKIKKLLIDKDLSQTAVAKDAGISRQYFNNMLSGHSGDLPDSWAKVFDVLGVKVDIVPIVDTPKTEEEPTKKQP